MSDSGHELKAILQGAHDLTHEKVLHFSANPIDPINQVEMEISPNKMTKNAEEE